MREGCIMYVYACVRDLLVRVCVCVCVRLNVGKWLDVSFSLRLFVSVYMCVRRVCVCVYVCE